MQPTKPFRRFVYHHKHTCNTKDAVWAMGPKAERNREQLVGIYGVGEDNSRCGEMVPRDSQQNGRPVGPVEV